MLRHIQHSSTTATITGTIIINPNQQQRSHLVLVTSSKPVVRPGAGLFQERRVPSHLCQHALVGPVPFITLCNVTSGSSGGSGLI